MVKVKVKVVASTGRLAGCCNPAGKAPETRRQVLTGWLAGFGWLAGWFVQPNPSIFQTCRIGL